MSRRATPLRAGCVAAALLLQAVLACPLLADEDAPPAPDPLAPVAAPVEDAPAPEPEPAPAPDEDGAKTPAAEDDTKAPADAPTADASEKPALPGPAPAGLDAALVAPPASERVRLRRLPIHGSLRLQYRMRAGEGDRDHDLYQYLALRMGRETDPGLSFSLHGRLTEDLDGGDGGSFYAFDSIADSYDSPVTGSLYHAYLNYRTERGVLEQVRLGRQSIEGGEVFLLDGLRLDFAPRGRHLGGLRAGVYGGVPAHLFEAWPRGDLLVGGWLAGQPWQGGDARVDLAYIEDESRYYGDIENTLLTFTLRQQLSRSASCWGAYQMLDADPRTLDLHLNAYDFQRDLSFRASFHGLLTAQRQRVTELDPFFAVAQDLEPYWTGSLAAGRGLSRVLFVEGGLDVRRLFDDADEGRFNREFERWFVTLSTDGWPARDINLSLTGERWRSTDDVWSLGFEVEHRPSKRVRLRVGTDYARYRFDLYTADELQAVRSYHVRLDVRQGERTRWHMRLRVEDDDFDTFVTLHTGVDLEF